MKSKQAKAAVERLLTGMNFQLRNAENDLRSIRATIERTYEAIRSSREALVPTNTLVYPNEGFDGELRRSS